jgi:CRISPR-associated protein Csb2
LGVDFLDFFRAAVDGDGRLDHLIITSPEPFSKTELAALDRLKSVWQPDGRPDVKFVLVSLSAKSSQQYSASWVSATPFVTKRHYRKGRGKFDEWLKSEIVKECLFHALPAPARIEFIPTTFTGGRKIRWAEFVRSRKKSDPLRGSGCMLEFDSPIAGPFAIGAGCHFGLGLFKPYET